MESIGSALTAVVWFYDIVWFLLQDLIKVGVIKGINAYVGVNEEENKMDEDGEPPESIIYFGRKMHAKYVLGLSPAECVAAGKGSGKSGSYSGVSAHEGRPRSTRSSTPSSSEARVARGTERRRSRRGAGAPRPGRTARRCGGRGADCDDRLPSRGFVAYGFGGAKAPRAGRRRRRGADVARARHCGGVRR